MHIQVIGPDLDTNNKFIEKMANKTFSILNKFQITTEREYDSNAIENYLILPEDLNLDNQEKQSWMEFYFKNNMVLVSKF